MSFAIQLLRKICCTFTAAYVREPGFILVADLASEIKKKNNNNNYYYYLLQLGCYPVAVVILHVYKI